MYTLYMGKVFVQAFYRGQNFRYFSHLNLCISIYKTFYGVQFFKYSSYWESTVVSQFHNPVLIRIFIKIIA